MTRKTANAASRRWWRGSVAAGQFLTDGLEVRNQTGRVAFDNVPNFLIQLRPSDFPIPTSGFL